MNFPEVNFSPSNQKIPRIRKIKFAIFFKKKGKFVTFRLQLQVVKHFKGTN